MRRLDAIGGYCFCKAIAVIVTENPPAGEAESLAIPGCGKTWSYGPTAASSSRGICMAACHALYPPPNKQNSGQAFVWMDRYLDSARVGRASAPADFFRP